MTKDAQQGELSADWREDCLHWRGAVLTGKYAHWCAAYDDLPVDETCPEWPCACAAQLRRTVAGSEHELVRQFIAGIGDPPRINLYRKDIDLRDALVSVLADAAIGRVVFDFIDRMADARDFHDPATELLDEFIAAVKPLLRSNPETK